MLGRRNLVRGTAALLLRTIGWSSEAAAASSEVDPRTRVRPGAEGWPSEAKWEQLNRDTGGRLLKIRSPLVACEDVPDSSACSEVFRELQNPYYIGVVRYMILEGLQKHPTMSGVSPEIVATTVSWAIYGAAKECVQTPNRCPSEEIAETVVNLVSPIFSSMPATVGMSAPISL